MIKLFWIVFLMLSFSSLAHSVGICSSAFDLSTKFANKVASTSGVKAVYEINKMTVPEVQNMSPQIIPSIRPESFALMSSKLAQSLRLVQLERITPAQSAFMELPLLTSIQRRTLLSPFRLWISDLSMSDTKTIAAVDIKDVFNDLTFEQKMAFTKEQFNELLPNQKQFMMANFRQLNNELQPALAREITAVQIERLSSDRQKALANDFNWPEVLKVNENTFNNIFRGLSVANRQRLDKDALEKLSYSDRGDMANDITVDQFQQLTSRRIRGELLEQALPKKQKELAPYLTAKEIERLYNYQQAALANDFNWPEVLKVNENTFNNIFRGLSVANRQRLDKDALERLFYGYGNIEDITNDITVDQFQQLTNRYIRRKLLEQALPKKQKELAPYLPAKEIEVLSLARQEAFANDFNWSEVLKVDKYTFSNIFRGLSVANRQRLDGAMIKGLYMIIDYDILARDITLDQFRQLIDEPLTNREAVFIRDIFQKASLMKQRELVIYLPAEVIDFLPSEQHRTFASNFKVSEIGKISSRSVFNSIFESLPLDSAQRLLESDGRLIDKLYRHNQKWLAEGQQTSMSVH